MKSLAMLIGTVLLLAGLAMAQEQKPQAPAQPSPTVHQAPARETYRMDYTITETEDGKKVNSRTYTVMCEDQGNATRGVLKVGSRVPIVTGSFSTGRGDGASPMANQFTYLDVGMNIDAKLSTTSDGGLSLESEVEMSSIADSTVPNQASAPVIRQLRVSSNNAITVGKPVVISTADDVASHRQFQIQVVATKLK